MSSNNNDQPSTLQSYIDGAGATLQSALGSITGNQADKAQAQDRQAKADAKDELSHSSAKLGGVTATPEGGVAVDNKDRQEGSWNQTVGSAKAAVGGFVGAEGLKREGNEQNRQGQAQEAHGQLNDLGSGVSDRIQGAVGSGIAGLTGDKAGQEHYDAMHADGKATQRGAENDIEKQNR